MPDFRNLPDGCDEEDILLALKAVAARRGLTVEELVFSIVKTRVIDDQEASSLLEFVDIGEYYGF